MPLSAGWCSAYAGLFRSHQANKYNGIKSGRKRSARVSAVFQEGNTRSIVSHHLRSNPATKAVNSFMRIGFVKKSSTPASFAFALA